MVINFNRVADNQTQPTQVSPEAYLDSLDDKARVGEALELLSLMASATNTAPIMWGPSIIGFGVNEYVYESGRTGTAPAIGLALRKKALVIYGVHQTGEEEKFLLEIGPHKMGKGCLYIESLEHINLRVLRGLLKSAFKARNNAPAVTKKR